MRVSVFGLGYVGCVTAACLARTGHDAVVAVTDEGEGIPDEEQARVFDRFHRVENDTTQLVPGAGLGLYIAKQLVEAMHGRLWLHSDPGYGSTFWFSLPLTKVQAPPGIQIEVVTSTGVVVVEDD